MKARVSIIILIILGFVQCNAQPFSKSWTDINYAGDTLVSHRMDVYLPVVGKPPYPAVIIVYGSAFFGNDQKHTAYNTLGEPLLNSGFAVVTVNHRSSRDAIFPAQVQDIKASVRFIRAKSTEFQIDNSFIGITGYSSGGHLSAFTGTSGSVSQLEGNVGHNTSFSSSVDAVVDWFGPTDFQSMDSCGSSPHDPPFLIFHGDADPLVPHCQSEKLFAALQKAGVPSQLVLVPNAGHGPGLFEEKYFLMMTEFFMEANKKKGS
jgi:acetyl esterase/lipase